MRIQVHADPITINCRKVIAGLEMMQAPYDLVHVDYFKGEQKMEPFISLNPNAALPAITDGPLVLWESNAILTYAADKVANDAVYPRDPVQRAEVNRWLFWESASWFPACYVFLVENCVKPLLGSQPDPAVLDAQVGQFHKLAGILDRHLQDRQWLVAERPTIADIAIASPMHLHAWQRLPLADHPHLQRWMRDGVEQLPSWRKTAVGEGFTLQQPA